MTLQDILDHLTFGEFQQLFVSTEINAGTEDADNNKVAAVKILPSVRLGLTELHKRFLLREGTLTVSLDGRSTYVLTKIKTVSNNGTDQYIQDTADEPFLDDVMKIERVLDNDGCEIPFNKEAHLGAVRATSYNTLLVPTDLKRASGTPVTTLTVIYRANHVPINTETALQDPTTASIDLPVTHLEALLAYIAARVVTPLGFSGESHEGNNYMAKFERACQVLNAAGMQVDTARESTKLQDRGWV